ncbi:MAG TPA: hypothetical protein VGB37_09950 [Candidatus Lokiarchaeia archaeon]
MKIKILKIIKTNDVYNGINKAGKPYSLYQWFCDIDNNGMLGKYVIKTMSKQTADAFKEGIEYDVKEQTFNNQVSYMIDSQANRPAGTSFQKKTFYQQGKMSKSEYLTFVSEAFNKAKELAKEDNELLKTLFDKILGCGCVLIDTNKTTTSNIKDVFNNNENDENISF